MTAHTTDALASALPAGITYPADDSKAGKAFTARWDTREIAAFQAGKLAESSYVLVLDDPEQRRWCVEDVLAALADNTTGGAP